jgi:hypothetical protein
MADALIPQLKCGTGAFEPNCSEGKATRQGSDPIGLSLGRLMAECPKPDDPAWTPAYHSDGSLVHVRYGGETWCWDRDVAVISVKLNDGHRYTDAQRDYWSRSGRGR